MPLPIARARRASVGTAPSTVATPGPLAPVEAIDRFYAARWTRTLLKDLGSPRKGRSSRLPWSRRSRASRATSISPSSPRGSRPRRGAICCARSAAPSARGTTSPDRCPPSRSGCTSAHRSCTRRGRRPSTKPRLHRADRTSAGLSAAAEAATHRILASSSRGCLGIAGNCRIHAAWQEEQRSPERSPRVSAARRRPPRVSAGRRRSPPAAPPCARTRAAGRRRRRPSSPGSRPSPGRRRAA